jgi:hypothetical protein
VWRDAKSHALGREPATIHPALSPVRLDQLVGMRPEDLVIRDSLPPASLERLITAPESPVSATVVTPAE